MHDRQKTLKGQPACHGGHILLGDAVFDKTFGECPFKGARPAVSRKVGVEDDDVMPFCACLKEGVAVCVHDPLAG
ncbi:MAG: hypothetical protein A4E64_02833 [Syntrophorhabdus sp. PtaU1.Bin058]|nr:MAG: hypothetical protein A4E64_02833 [Syntrophorhabdus sp. PtaU1.Bin058]